ncbi:MAG: glycosyltransferase family 4 protein [Acidobacteriia bacterium]|nr:glycosyltransferase family 4 protein [Terriglobia bacterium]MBV8902452.1 glycosyltransferase family 4 protein [Terriglobia bacterium]MBV9743825.1 glycosyltransferase family 4 protein [Terriglobia bacterium]
MKIAIVVPGRFHAFDLARSLIERGHQIRIFTTYPRWAARRFGLEPGVLCSFWPLGILDRAAARMGLSPKMEAFHLTSFGKWAAREVSRESWDIVHEFSGAGEEVIRATRGKTCHLLLRGSAHIRTQAELLRQEAERTRVTMEQPSPWIIKREEREYAAADYMVVISRFCYNSFVRQGVPAEKLLLLPLGVDTRAFRASEEMIERRCQRILSGVPLTVLTTGQVSFRKGLYDFAKIANACDGRMRFRWIGVVREEARETVRKLPACVQMMAHQPQWTLPRAYADADVFLLPTIEDGYALVLAQASANSLPILTTTNCSGPDIIHEGQSGWVLPIRNPEAFIKRLLWCDAHREQLARMVRDIARKFQPRNWSDVAADFESLCAAAAV